MKTLFPILSNITMLALLCLVLVAFCERLAHTLLAHQVRRNLARAEHGLDSAYSMRDYREVFNQRRAMRYIILALALGIAGSATYMATVKAEQLTPAIQGQHNLSKRNELLAQAEKMARAGNKGLMRANITFARKFGPVDALMVWRIEEMLAQ